MNSFDPDSFNLIGEGAFSSVYFCNVQGPLSTPTNLHHFKNCVEHPVAVKICKGKYIQLTLSIMYPGYNELLDITNINLRMYTYSMYSIVSKRDVVN